MPQPFAVGDVVGGRYRITHHVVTSADQDIVFEGTDQVLNREVSILLASRSNAKQVATSAKELATGERVSEVQVLDLGLAEDRTYLIASLTDPNGLLDLVVPDAAPYVEPFFTDSLGSEIFGQSRVMEPETYEDDEEYYAALTESESEGARKRPPRRRPGFLDRVSDSLNRRLGTSESRGARGAGHPEAGSQSHESQSHESQSPTSQPPEDAEAAEETSPDEVGHAEHVDAESTGADDRPAAHTHTQRDADRAETEDAISAGQQALEQQGSGIADAPQAPVAAYRDSEMPQIPQPELPERIDESEGPEEPEELAGLATDDATPSAQQEPQAGAARPSEEPESAEPEEFSASAAGVSEVRSSRRPRRGRRPERTAGIAAGIPALADLSLAGAASSADTEDAFGVRSDDHGGYVPLSDAEAARRFEPQDEPQDETRTSQPHEGRTEDGAVPAGSATDPWAEDPDPEDVVDDPPSEPTSAFDRRGAVVGAGAAGASAAAVAGTDVSGELYSEQHDPGSASAATGAAFVDDEHGAAASGREPALAGAAGAGAGAAAGTGGRGSGPGRWLALLLLGAVLLVVGIVIFTQLGGGDDVADGDGDDEAVTEGEEEDGEGEEADEPELAVTSVTREVPDNAELGAEFDEDLDNLIDDDESTSWGTFNYGNAAFGGYASQMAVVAELEESGEVTQVTVDQDPTQQGGSFEILVNDEPTVEGATNVGSGSFGEEPAVVDLDEPTETAYVILNITEIPENSEPDNPDLPYRLDIREFDVR